MRDNQANLIRMNGMLFQDIARGFVHGSNRQFKDFFALHFHEVVTRGDLFSGGR